MTQTKYNNKPIVNDMTKKNLGMHIGIYCVYIDKQKTRHTKQDYSRNFYYRRFFFIQTYHSSLNFLLLSVFYIYELSKSTHLFAIYDCIN